MLYGYTKDELSFDEHVTSICCKATKKQNYQLMNMERVYAVRLHKSCTII